MPHLAVVVQLGEVLIGDVEPLEQRWLVARHVHDESWRVGHAHMLDAILVLGPTGFGLAAGLAEHHIDGMYGGVAHRLEHAVPHRTPRVVLAVLDLHAESVGANVGESVAVVRGFHRHREIGSSILQSRQDALLELLRAVVELA